MNPEVKAAWVAALRSGEYTQGVGALSRNGRQCCLGVLCELAVKAGVTVRTRDGLTTGYGHGPLDDPTVLPRVVTEWAGLAHDNPPVFKSSGEMAFLAEMNDGLGDCPHHDFSQIADIIEEQL